MILAHDLAYVFMIWQICESILVIGNHYRYVDITYHIYVYVCVLMCVPPPLPPPSPPSLAIEDELVPTCIFNSNKQYRYIPAGRRI